MPIGVGMTDLKDTGDQPIPDITASVDELMADASAAAAAAAGDVRTYRGRSLEELIPRIREELGADAIVVRSREGLAGGVAGFFQKQFVEVEARSPLAHEHAAGELARNDRATSEGLATPGVKALIDGAQPFSAELAFVQAGASERADAERMARASAFEADPLPASAGLYGPQPNLESVQSAAAAALPAAYFTPSAALPAAAAAPASVPTSEPVATDAPQVTSASVAAAGDWPAPADARPPRTAPPAPTADIAGAPRSDDAARVTRLLMESGLSAELASDVVGEAVDHFMPFAAGRSLERHAAGVLARRIPVLADLGPGRRVLAFVGGGGSGKTSAAANLAVAYASAGRRVAAIALGDGPAARDLAARLEPLGIFVHVAGTGAEARDLIARIRPDLAVVDASESADPAESAAVASDLRELRAHEVHLAVPATLSASAAAESHARQRALGITHLCLTHFDGTASPGAPIGLAVDRNLPVSYLCTRATIEPADGARLASRLLPGVSA